MNYKFFVEVAEKCPYGIIILYDNKILYANKKLVKTLGYSEEEFSKIEISLYENQDSLLVPFVIPIPDTNDEKDVEEKYLIKAKKKEGDLILLHLSVSRFDIESKIYIVGYLEENILDKFDFKEYVLFSKIYQESLHDIYIINESDLRITNANQGALLKVGYSLEEIKTLSPWDLMPDYDARSFMLQIEPLITGEVSKVIFETEFFRRDSSIFPVEVQFQLFKNGNKEVIVETVIDLTEKKRVEREHLISLIQAQDFERERIARELHDDLGQYLTAIQLNVNTLEQYCGKQNQVEADEIFEKLNIILFDTIRELKSISRDLMPGVLMNFGLVKGLQNLCENFTSHDLQVSLQVYNVEVILETSVNVALYRITQELLNNAVKHGKAKEINVQLIQNDKSVVLTVEDDGVGFDINLSLQDGGLGIKNIQSRVIALGGNFSFDSRNNYGTSVLIEIPFI
jgi:PAS domain S-box-containing protein